MLKIYHSVAGFIRRRGKRFTINSDSVADCKFFGIPGKHVFFGYYDLPQIGADGSKMLVQAVDKKAIPGRDRAEIGYYDLTCGEYCAVGSTSAWCWQQGSRLRWHPVEPNAIVYNDVDNGRYVAKEYSIDTEESCIVAPALYDMSGDHRFGVSVNFARLQRLRRGYGYSALPDTTEKSPAPDDDGVFLVDLADGSYKLVAPLRELAMRNDNGLKYEHYINHVSFCPGGGKFIFFHIAKGSGKGFNRIIEVYLYDIDAGSMELILSDWITSHYAWRSDNELLITEAKGDITRYSIYDICTRKKQVIEHNDLREDGHPSFFYDDTRFICDTSPDEYNFQKLRIYDMLRGRVAPVAEFYHKPPKSSDMRCDLHPRLWEKDGRQIVTLDTTCSGARRVALLRLKS